MKNYSLYDVIRPNNDFTDVLARVFAFSDDGIVQQKFGGSLTHIWS
jgi:hypothetical protein